MSVLEFWVILNIVGFVFQARVLNSQNLLCNPGDLKALESFLNGTSPGLRGWSFNSSSDCCTWEGVTCNSSSSLGSNDLNVTARVTKLELAKKKLTGHLSESLGSLDELRTLNLSCNSLGGTIPSSLFLLSKLETLDLSSNNFVGQIPANFNMPNIQYLQISQNRFSGQIPTNLCNNSSKMWFIDLGMNYFNGNIRPSIGNCSLLQHLCLSSNHLTGEIPDNLFRLKKLDRLSFQDNFFSGKIGEGIGNLSNLVRLDFSMNNFSGNLPNVFHSFKNLQSFLANSNHFTGSIPSSLSSLSMLTLLNLNNNSFMGQITLDCASMVSLISLDLGSNEFNGQIPDNLPACIQLKNINLSKNNFSGQIPESYKDFPSLSYLSLSNSSVYNISSALQILQQCKNLTTLVLTLNFANEELPSDPSLHFEKLKVLIIANCGLTGSIPIWLSGSSKLQLLDLSWNHLAGTIPAWFGDFDFLFYLDLSNNSFSGEIPINITGLKSLINQSISLEEPSPDFPFFMKRNSNSSRLQYKQVWSFPPTLDLSVNSLTGPIWPEFGNLKKLHFFELKSNYLSGNIPNELSGMTSLETLDLSHNNLTGSIPSSLVNLSFLSRFSVAYNNLSGKIPTGGQFQTFTIASFEGNNGLCSDHTFTCPSDNQVQVKSGKKAGRKKGTIIGMAIGIGFGTAFLLALMAVIILRTKKRGNLDFNKREIDGPDLEQLRSRLVLFKTLDNSNHELTIDELLKSTNNFDQENIIGCGGFGLVYKAILSDGRRIAIKKLSGDCGQVEREFQAEVEALSRAQHPNLVLLQGFCIYNHDRLLIYTYMENGSLDYWLHEKIDGPSALDWPTRLTIAQGAARGLEYLHQSCDPHILHRDIKSSNILLDANFRAHLADFGLARLLLSPYDTHVTTDLVGTLGYIPPEYGQASIATYKGDVYSFGVVLLELLTGKRPMDMCKPKGSRDMISWVIQMKKENRETEVFDPFIYDKENEKKILRVLYIACLCLSECPKSRPTTQQLVSWLDEVGLVGV